MAATSKNKVTLTSRFPAAKRGMWEAVSAARDKALNEGEAEAEKRLERANDAHGWNLPMDIEQEKTGHQSGLIRYPDWWGKFFEYGTVYIQPAPFMRPAHRKMRKVFRDELGEEAPKWIRKKVGKISGSPGISSTIGRRH